MTKLMVGWHGTAVPDSLKKLLDHSDVAGAIWFKRNVESPEQVSRVNEALISRRPDLLIAVDQEGGNVRRLRQGFTDVPAMREVATVEQAYDWGRALGRDLATAGFNMNLAPVLDVDSNPANPIIGQRSFSRDPVTVGRMAVALHKGLASQGVMSCGKHFPGHGDTDLDSHLDLPRLAHQRERLDALELVPFRMAIQAGFPALMTAHIMLPALDPDWPATLSPTIIGGILRTELGFDGLILSDDLEMKAVADRWPIETIMERCAAASVDLALICSDLAKQRRALKALSHLA